MGDAARRGRVPSVTASKNHSPADGGLLTLRELLLLTRIRRQGDASLRCARAV